MQSIHAAIHKHDLLFHSVVLSRFKIVCKVSTTYKTHSWGMLLIPSLYAWSLAGQTWQIGTWKQQVLESNDLKAQQPSWGKDLQGFTNEKQNNKMQAYLDR